MIRNPFQIGIETSLRQLSLLSFAPGVFVPSLVALFGWSVVLVTSLLLYPYGMFPMVVVLFGTLVKDTKAAMDRASFAERFPFGVAIGVYLSLMAPFVVISAPFWVVGALTGWLRSTHD
jgi:hypothetical protein